MFVIVGVLVIVGVWVGVGVFSETLRVTVHCPTPGNPGNSKVKVTSKLPLSGRALLSQPFQPAVYREA